MRGYFGNVEFINVIITYMLADWTNTNINNTINTNNNINNNNNIHYNIHNNIDNAPTLVADMLMAHG